MQFPINIARIVALAFFTVILEIKAASIGERRPRISSSYPNHGYINASPRPASIISTASLVSCVPGATIYTITYPIFDATPSDSPLVSSQASQASRASQTSMATQACPIDFAATSTTAVDNAAETQNPFVAIAASATRTSNTTIQTAFPTALIASGRNLPVITRDKAKDAFQG